MALTQSARLPGPSWDETIVPALRKRLESESRTLTKRMSAVSISSLDEAPSPNPSTKTDSTIREPRPAYLHTQSHNGPGSGVLSRSGFPSRVSAEQDRDRDVSPRINGSSSSSKPPSFKRTRTYSQPFSSDQGHSQNVNGNGHAHPYPKTNGTKAVKPSFDSARSTSPPYPNSRPTDPKPTRIPKARGRAGSTSSHGHGQPQPQHQMNLNGYNPYNHPPSPPDATTSPDLYVVQESSLSPSARSDTSSVGVPSRQSSGLLNEPAPFKPASITSSAAHDEGYGNTYGYGYGVNDAELDVAPPRPSNESEERPFEHWYRGEVSRNGGVGELRVGKRMEMLEIANYGHTIKKKNAQLRANQGIGMVPVDDGMGIASRRRRKRADSVSGILGDGRESIYLDEERAREIARVLDESPLTDLDTDPDGEDEGDAEDDGDTDMEDFTARYQYIRPEDGIDDSQRYAAGAGGEAGNISTTSAPIPHEYRSGTPTSYHRPSSRQQNAPPTRIPGPTPRQSSEPPRVPTPTQMPRGASEPPSFPSSSSPSPPPSSSRQRQQSQSKSQPQTPSSQAKGGRKSPASAPGPGTAKKKAPPTAGAKARAKTLATRKQMEEDAKRKSVAYYPSPGGGGDGDMMDAIPSWTQPVPREGNWDEVVLPVVARKKGLDGHYEQADGSPRPKKPDNVVAPAPGTFGYDHSKYRPPRGEESIPMDEFGRPADLVEEAEESRSTRDDHPRTTHDETRLPVRHPPPPSPAPFEHYAPPKATHAEPVPKISLARPSMEELDAHGQGEEDGAGCCKCVIM